MTCGGIVVNMTSLNKDGIGIRVYGNNSLGFYADVGGEQLWIDVLRATLERGLAPISWTDYLYLSVGGTLSNAGISGQTFSHGPQINNVIELDVITGKGEFMTCSRNRNPEVFFGVIGGLGQFGIITRARIVLEEAPTRVKWVRLLYSNFSIYSRDQEHLISSKAPNYVEGFLITNENTTNEWRSSFSSPSKQSDIVSLLKKQGIIYSIEVVKYYDNQTAGTIDQEFQKLLKELNFIPELIFSTDASLFDFLARVPILINDKGLESHPWLNLFIPKSRISDFNDGVLATMLPRLNETAGLYIFYPVNRNKWDDRMSAVIPDEDIFYGLGLLHTSRPDEYQIYDKFNNDILEFCEKAGIEVKQYLPHYTSKADWIKHYGSKWGIIQQRKAMFDPKKILSPGQRIFNSA
ncbi:Proteins containing the FAD binding domain [Handroanthus impetiginosus]|uniref:cytokinin dehydrogenase n=1 Tax=Handroanthus impetiginosus TaxID=429701 RepID=A0A2G9GBP2_9LAMI|nr:Proteins containing the FAD binding domain [Handroanthus impetiginosus]